MAPCLEVAVQLDTVLGPIGGLEFETHAGNDYLGFGLVTGLTERGAGILSPVHGLSLGQQLRFYRSEGQ